jgi:hypothetical protein
LLKGIVPETLAIAKENYTTVDPKQWVDSRSVLGNKAKDMK